MSNQDRIEGKAKEVAGKASGDDALEAEGKTQHAKGAVAEKVDELKDMAKGAAKAVRDAVSSDDDGDGDSDGDSDDNPGQNPQA